MADILSDELINNGSDDILTVPACVPVEDAIKKYVLSVGWEKCSVARKTLTRSKMYDFGVRLQSLTEKDVWPSCSAMGLLRKFNQNDGKGCSITFSFVNISSD